MFKDFFSNIQKANGMLPEEFLNKNTAEKLYIHISELEKKGKTFNLTAITDPEEIVNKHVIDCLFAAAQIKKLAGNEKMSLIDIGSGGGFPALPIACTLENISVSALDATAKKCVFIRETAEKCGIHLNVFTGRAEELSAKESKKNVNAENMRESFDFATARAVASLNILAELCLPFVKTGGYFLAMKGSAASEEAQAAENAVKQLGAVFEKNIPYDIPNGGKRHLLIYKKISPTPKEYPRKYSSIKKKPL